MVWSATQSQILQSEIKWALGRTAVNKASGCDGMPVELFKTLKDDTLKVLHSVCQQIWQDLAVATGLKSVSPHPSSQEG